MKIRRRIKPPEPPSMVNPSTDLLVRRTRSRYVLVMLASKRARQLLKSKGADCKVPPMAGHEDKYVTNAFEEIAKRKIRARMTVETEQLAIAEVPKRHTVLGSQKKEEEEQSKEPEPREEREVAEAKE